MVSYMRAAPARRRSEVSPGARRVAAIREKEIDMTTQTVALPDARGHFGVYGGRFVPETLIPALDELTAEYARACEDPAFQRELAYYYRDFIGRETPLYFAERLTADLGGPKIYLKREDLCH